MNSENFQSFFSIVSESSPTMNDGELVLSLSTKVSSHQIEETLTSVGYSFDDVRTIRQGKVNLSLNASDWSSSCPIYLSWEDLFTIVENTSKLPSYFYVLETMESSLDDLQNKRALELFCALRQLLASLADQCEPPQDGCGKGSRKLFYIIETEDGVVKYDFKPTLLWSELKETFTEDGQLSLIEKLRKLIALGDSQDSERRSVMRSAFHEIISTCHSSSEIFKKVINSIDNFHKRYEEHHDIFVRRFSINKVLHEINEKDLNYTSKINEILSSAQNKALTIPGALIVIGAVMKIDQMIDGVAVAIGMLMTTLIVHRSLNVHESTFDHIEKQITSEFKRYDVLNEKVEIRKRAKQTISELSILIDKAKKNSGFMRNSIWLICCLAIVFVIVVLNDDRSGVAFSKVPHQESSIISQQKNSDVISGNAISIDVVSESKPNKMSVEVSSDSSAIPKLPVEEQSAPNVKKASSIEE